MRKYTRRLRYEVTPLKPVCEWYDGCDRKAAHEAVPHVVIDGEARDLPGWPVNVCGIHALDLIAGKGEGKADVYLDEGRVVEVAIEVSFA